MVDGLKSLGCNAPHVIHNCVDTSSFRPNQFAKKEFVTTSFRMDHIPTLIKRGDNFIRAAAILAKEYSGLKFLIIGHKGDAYPNLKKLSEDLGLTNTVIFAGAIDNSEVVGYLQRSICFVQPSDTETFGVAVAEAMSVGCPVVISRRGALFEVASENGIYVDQNSPQSIASGVRNVFDMNSEDLLDLSNKSRMHIEENFSYEKRKAAILELVRAVFV
jgi:glycosyltransferase involved in cell wall biosynthesis